MRRTSIAMLAAALLLTGTALAARAPRPAERSAIGAIFHGYVQQPRSPAARDNRIVTLRISSRDPRYAAARLMSKSAGPSDMVFHRGAFGWSVVGFGSSLGCDSAPKAVLDDLRVGCTPPQTTAWIANCGPLVSAPRSLILACADANYQLASLHWRGWGSARAAATGAARANDCTPYCAAGHFHSYRMTATADRLTRCGAAHYYARLTIVYAGPRPKGVPRRDVHALGC